MDSFVNNTYQRIISIFLYTLPLKASLPLGYIFFSQYPYLKFIYFLAIPFSLLENALPFGSILIFFLIFIGLVRNPKVSYFIRYNACQAILLNIAIIILGYFIQLITLPELASLGFILSLGTFIFASVKCLFGFEPDIPLISRSARIQIL